MALLSPGTLVALVALGPLDARGACVSLKQERGRSARDVGVVVVRPDATVLTLKPLSPDGPALPESPLSPAAPFSPLLPLVMAVGGKKTSPVGGSGVGS